MQWGKEEEKRKGKRDEMIKMKVKNVANKKIQ